MAFRVASPAIRDISQRSLAAEATAWPGQAEAGADADAIGATNHAARNQRIRNE